MKKAILVLLVVLLAVIGTAYAIQYGQLDGEAHPHVGLLVFDVDGSPAWRCSGTLLSPTVMLTAGHCTFGTSGGRVWFDADVGAGRPDNNYPFSGNASVEFKEIYSHPKYVDGAFYLYDVGVVILSKPVHRDVYGVLPEIGLLDGLATERGLQEQTFVPVGYGLQSVVPELQRDLVRYNAEIMLVDVQGTAGIPAGTSVMFTNNPGQATTGGTCFGDSGGPIFYGHSNVVAAVTSFGLNQNCAGSGGGYRMDTADDNAFVSQFLGKGKK